jgi:phosphoglycerate dehydrogenase-like enzyme
MKRSTILASFVLAATLFCTTSASADVLNQGVEERVREVFDDAPIMVAILRCESGLKQYDSETGGPLMNQAGSSATGVAQIMASVHEKAARRLGFDIRTAEGNIAYAEYLYMTEGTRPWKASKHCWGKYLG